MLRVNGVLEIAAFEASEFISAIDDCYRGLSFFEDFIDEFGGRRRGYTRRFFHPEIPFYFFRENWREFPPEFLWREKRLVLQTARFESPGFWEFLGKLNPLEQIRLYLNDRHERRKDNEYRKRQEEEAADWAIEAQKTEVMRKKVELAKEMGATDEEIRMLFRSAVEPSLQRLFDAQDRGVIDKAKIRKLPNPDAGK